MKYCIAIVNLDVRLSRLSRVPLNRNKRGVGYQGSCSYELNRPG